MDWLSTLLAVVVIGADERKHLADVMAKACSDAVNDKPGST